MLSHPSFRLFFVKTAAAKEQPNFQNDWFSVSLLTQKRKRPPIPFGKKNVCQILIDSLRLAAMTLSLYGERMVYT